MAKTPPYADVHAAARAGDAAALRSALSAARNAKRAANSRASTGEVPFQWVIGGGHLGLLPILAEAGADLRRPDFPVFSALALTASSGNLALLQELLTLVPAADWSNGEIAAAVEKAGDQNAPALLDALPASGVPLGKVAARAAFLGHAATLAWCLDHGTAPDTASSMGGDTLPLIHHAAEGAQPATAAVIVGAGGDPEQRDPEGRTPLMRAARQEPKILAGRIRSAGHPLPLPPGAPAPADPPPADGPDTVVAILLAAGADPARRDPDGFDALAILETEYSDEMADIAAAGTSYPATMLASVARDTLANAADLDPWTHLAGVFHAGLQQAGAAGENAADQAVAAAVRAGDPGALRDALSAGGSANAPVLLQAGHDPITVLALAARGEHTACCQLLLDAGANPNDGGRAERPLHTASRQGDIDTVRLLLAHGADPYLPEADDGSSIDNAIAIARMAEREEVVAILKAAGPAATSRDEPTLTPDAHFVETTTELLVRADAAATANALATTLGGEAEHAVYEQTIRAARARGYLVVQLPNSAWSSVIGHIGADTLVDDAWQALAGDVSAKLSSRTALLCHDDTSGTHAYWLYDSGDEIERFEEDLVDPPGFGNWFSARGRPEPGDMTDGAAVVQRLAEEEGLCIFVSRPPGVPGEPFEVEFAGDPRLPAAVAYVRLD